MPFPPDVKARIFVRSARICALCYKQCGTNIEAAHIVAEADGGANDDDNAIPLCFDCHQEIGAYDLRHPRGNKFSEVELKARRDQLYGLVESGTLQALIVVNRLQAGAAEIRYERAAALNDKLTQGPSPSAEAQAVLEHAMSDWVAPAALAAKLELLSNGDRAFVLDRLIDQFAKEVAANSLAAVLKSELLSSEFKMVVVERLLRRVTLIGDISAKAHLMSLVPSELIQSTDTDLKLAFFREIIGIMHRDQFSEVNRITPAAVEGHDAIPDELHREYMDALLSQAKSSAYQGAPAAQRALQHLPEPLARAGLATLDDQRLLYEHGDHLKDFVRRYRNFWQPDNAELLEDFANLSHHDFVEQHWSRLRGSS